MIVVIGGKTIKGNIVVTVNSEEEDVPVSEGGLPPSPPVVQ